MNPTKFGKLIFSSLALIALLALNGAAQENSKPNLCETVRQDVSARLDIAKTYTVTISDGPECEYNFWVRGRARVMINAYKYPTAGKAHDAFVKNYRSMIPQSELESGETVKFVSSSHWNEMVILKREKPYSMITFRYQNFYVDVSSRDYPLLEQIESLFKDIRFENL